MGFSNDNLIKPTIIPGTEMAGRRAGQEIGQKRRALSIIDQNLVGGHAYGGCVVKKAICGKLASKNANTGKHVPQNKPDPKEFGDFIFIDEECKSPDEHPVPMFLEDTEAILEEKTQMEEEVEMEDVVEEPISDIDSCDAENPLAAVDYVVDLYAYYKKMEFISCVSPNYMAQQSDINEKMRAILIDWLIEVHDKFELMSETLYLTVNVIDRFLAQQKVARKKLQLVGLVAMLLACKYEEVSVPVLSDLIVISDNAYSRKEVIKMETLMLNTLQFNMSVPTPYVFTLRYLKAAQSDKKVELLSFFLLELCLVEYEMLKYPPSLLAASAIYVAQCTVHGYKRWSRTCERHSSYSQEQLLECSRMMMGHHQNASTGKLRAVYGKYSSSKLQYISKHEAAAACHLFQT